VVGGFNLRGSLMYHAFRVTLELSSVIRGLSVSDGLSASYPAIRSTDPSSYTCDADAPNRIARSLIRSASIFDEVTMTD
jgi:hypothetical protein